MVTDCFSRKRSNTCFPANRGQRKSCFILYSADAFWYPDTFYCASRRRATSTAGLPDCVGLFRWEIRVRQKATNIAARARDISINGTGAFCGPQSSHRSTRDWPPCAVREIRPGNLTSLPSARWFLIVIDSRTFKAKRSWSLSPGT